MSEKKYFNFLKDNVNWILFIGLILTIAFPLLLVLPAPFKFMQISNINFLGSNIGGLTAPIIGFLGAFLIYLAFNEQNIRNKRNELNREFDIYNNMIESINSEINSISFYNKVPAYKYRSGNPSARIESMRKGEYELLLLNGSYALFIYSKEYDKKEIKRDFNYESDPILIQLIYILRNLEYLLDEINSSEIKENEKFILQNKINMLYRSKLKMSVENFIYLFVANAPDNVFYKEIRKIDEKLKNAFK